ncbi:hypothetical protein CEE69_29555 [Rhodopirellula bahusiensis]|uniref:Uncharacterized protein n=1 Tax=Rhodopirellula bahusiensis TaxID=2014065 RepID=A0A2G1VZ76_9BACT|nr:hypothetical protein CEE69_29555 [Rhodopirellula bahusiensis]
MTRRSVTWVGGVDCKTIAGGGRPRGLAAAPSREAYQSRKFVTMRLLVWTPRRRLFYRRRT